MFCFSLAAAVALLLCLLPSACAQAAIKLPDVISSNMVLQQGMAIPIWGWAVPGERVTVSLAGQRLTTVADNDGKWIVRFDALQAGGPLDMTVTASNTLTITNIVVGEIWLCSGQSNMYWPVTQCKDAAAEIANASHPMIRLFTAKHVPGDDSQNTYEGAWVECNPQTVEQFSAVGYYFGRSLHTVLNVPVGLIHASRNGSQIEAWMSPEVLKSDKAFETVFARQNSLIQKYPAKREQWEKNSQAVAMKAYGKAVEKAKAQGHPIPAPPRGPVDPRTDPNAPSNLYNNMIAPLMPFAMRGVIWYQGETNASRPAEYRRLFPALIADWRGHWGQGNFPFLFVQLANYGNVPPGRWPWLREAQFQTLAASPNTAMAVAIDIGEDNCIHPANKQDVAMRLSLAAQKIAYGKDVCDSGPVYQAGSIEVRGRQAILRFQHVGGGLVASDGGALEGFAVASADRNFVPAQAHIDGDTVIVSSDEVATPAAVRYAWSNNPACNLYNREGLPASPFRTDDWPIAQE